MSDSVEQPNWDTLPHDPQAFFELADGFERRDLKRSYSRLIRVYKPERHPEEFQRIRAAYEQLDRELRYGRSAETTKPPVQRWDATAETTDGEVSEQKPLERRSVPQQLIDRVLSESPQLIYDEISERADKSPYDFYCLAILSDLLNPRKTLRFTRWLVKGIEAHPFEPNLLYLLREDLTLTVTEADLPNMLEACAVAVPRDQFYALTEPAWERLLRTIPFTEFITLLESCERHLRDISISYRVTFIMRVLRHAVWSGQREWVDEAFAFVEQNFQEIPAALENEIELLATVDEYATLREQFLDGNPLREQMDNALRQYMTQEAAVGDQVMLDVQLAILAEPKAVLTAFPPNDEERVAAFYNAWVWAAADVGERYGTASSHIDARLWRQRVSQMLEKCLKEAGKHPAAKKFRLCESLLLAAGWVGGILLLFFMVIFFRMLIKLLELSSEAETAGILISVFGSIGFVIWLAVSCVQKASEKYITPLASETREKIYHNIYRQESGKFLQQTQISFYGFRQLTDAPWMNRPEIHRLQDDYGLAIYSLALPLAT